MVILIFSVMSYMDYRVFQDFASAYKLLLRNDLIASGSAAYSCTCFFVIPPYWISFCSYPPFMALNGL